MKHFNTLIIKSRTNPDCNGTYKVHDVIEEMNYLGMTPTGNDWIEYVIGHFDFPAAIDDAILNDDIQYLKFNFDGDIVIVEKL